jgi:predicted nucleic acid-binding protein
MLAVVDTGPLYAAVDADDADHARCVAALPAPGVRLVVPALLIAEATYLIDSRMGSQIEAAFLRGCAELEVAAPEPPDWERVAELVEDHADFPLGGTDASVVALAERLDTPLVITLDDRHFRAVVPKHRKSLRLLPSDA